MILPRDHAALSDYLDSRLAMPHDWNGNCCVAFVLGAVEAQFGLTPRPAASWSTPRGAARAIKRFGGIAAEASRLFEEIEPAFAQRGDIAGYEHPEHGLALAVVEGQTICAPGERGLLREPRTRMTRAWRARPVRHG